MEIKWTDSDPETGQRRFLCAEKFAGEWRFRWKLQRRGSWTRGLEPTLEMWEHVLDSLKRRYRRREGVSDEDVEQVEGILADLNRANTPVAAESECKHVEAPTPYSGSGLSLFLAGGITGCPGWQHDLAHKFADLALVVLNPRRSPWPDDPDAAREQITWEHRHLRLASAILFWFPSETLCPIALYELGAWSMTTKKLFVGVHPDYARRFDVETQTRLARPEIVVVSSLEALEEQVRVWAAIKSRLLAGGRS